MRFQPQITNVDTSNFSQTAGIRQEGRNRSQDRQLAAKELLAKISQDGVDNNLRQQQIQLEYERLEQQAQMQLHELAVQMENIRGNLVNQARGQDINKSLERQKLGQLRQKDIEADALERDRLDQSQANTDRAFEYQQDRDSREFSANRSDVERAFEYQQDRDRVADEQADQELAFKKSDAEAERQNRIDVANINADSRNKVDPIERTAQLGAMVSKTNDPGSIDPEKVRAAVNSPNISDEDSFNILSQSTTQAFAEIEEQLENNLNVSEFHDLEKQYFNFEDPAVTPQVMRRWYALRDLFYKDEGMHLGNITDETAPAGISLFPGIMRRAAQTSARVAGGVDNLLSGRKFTTGEQVQDAPLRKVMRHLQNVLRAEQTGRAIPPIPDDLKTMLKDN